jgi:predicted  nucleic acid-binding Zn-ribbon protein
MKPQLKQNAEIREQRTRDGRRNIACLTCVICYLLSVICLLSLAGCYQSEPGAISDWGLDASPDRNASAQKFPSTRTEPTTAVESAIALSDKYAKLSEEHTVIKQQKQALETENHKLKEDLQSCRSRLEQAQKELDEVNDLLVEMRLELNNWKSDVLGFRDEMRDAEKAQLEALLKVLKLLGGEVKTEAAPPSSSAQPTEEEQK